MKTTLSEPSKRPRVYADFNKSDGDSISTWLVLTCKGTCDDLTRLNIELKEGLELLLYTDDADEKGNYDELEADGVVHFDAVKNHWIARVNWNSLRHVSDRC